MTNAPGMPISVDEDSIHVEMGPDGEPRMALDVTFRAEDIQKMRAGYKCLRCWEEFPNAWPEWCTVCNYKIKESQSRDFAKEYGGEKWVGPSTTTSYELDRLDWEHDKRMWEKHGSKGILVPRGSVKED